MSRKYRIGDQLHAHFVTLTVLQWIDFFIRDEYRQIFIKSIQHCQQHKGLEVYGYCIMSSHVHLIIRAGEKELLENVLRDIKRYTAKCFHDSLLSEYSINESRKAGCYNYSRIKTAKDFNSGSMEIIP